MAGRGEIHLMRADYEILTTRDRSRWLELIESTSYADLNFHPDYLSPFEEHVGSRAYLLKIDVGEDFILFPYFERPLGNGDFDATSPWYYGGPIPSGPISREGFGTFLDNLGRILADRGNISLFSRFHPYLKNHRNMEEFTGFKKLGTVIPVYLERDFQEILQEELSKKCRRDVEKNRRAGITVVVDEDGRLIGDFHDIYSRSMELKNSHPFYRFGLGFLEALKKGLGSSVVIFAQYLGDDLLGASIKIHMYGRMYGFLGARDRVRKGGYSTHLVHLEAIRYGIDRGLKVVDLGGGPEGSGLLKFKRGFSREELPLYGMSIVLDREAYIEQCKKVGLGKNELGMENASFFPEYRKPDRRTNSRGDN